MDSPNRQDPRGKWLPNWEVPYVVQKAFSRGALILTEMDRKEFSGPINADIVKKYYASDDKGSDVSELKTKKGDFGKQKKKKEKKKKRFKVKTRKDSLIHKK